MWSFRCGLAARDSPSEFGSGCDILNRGTYGETGSSELVSLTLRQFVPDWGGHGLWLRSGDECGIMSAVLMDMRSPMPGIGL